MLKFRILQLLDLFFTCILLRALAIRAGKKGWSLKALLTDFHLLLFLGEFMDFDEDLPRICRALCDPEIPLAEGDVLVIQSMAGL